MFTTGLYMAVTRGKTVNIKACTIKKCISIAVSLFFTCSLAFGMETGDYSEVDQDAPVSQGAFSDESEAGKMPEVQLGQEDILDLDCLIVFEYSDDIWLIDDDSIAVNLTNTGNIFNFTCDRAVPGLILFSVLNEELDLDIFMLSIEESMEPEYIGSVLNETGNISYFVSEICDDRAQMEVEGNELKIECAFVFGGSFDFTDFVLIDLSLIRGEAGTSEIIQYSTTEDSNIQITNEIVGDICELFCLTQNETYQLTNTSDILRFDTYGYYFQEEPLNFRLSPPGGKVLFSVLQDFGDLAHGPMLIVNIDGTNQQQLDSDAMFHNFNREWVGDKLLYIGNSAEYRETDLFLIDSYDNVPKLVVSGINQFDVIHRKQ